MSLREKLTKNTYAKAIDLYPQEIFKEMEWKDSHGGTCNAVKHSTRFD